MLGRDNISSPTIAVLELVKNAYDADATHVRITFRQASKDGGEILIEDDGEGMDLTALTDKWMVISTNDKVRHPRTNNGRIKVGEKGIGRLALDRLCRKVAITTYRPNNASRGLRLEIDWDKYEHSRGDLHNVKHPLSAVHFSSDALSGTTLHLTELRHQWTDADYERLYSDLALLVPPFDDNLVDFKITFDCDEAPRLSGPVTSPMTGAAEYVLESVLTASGRISHTLKHRSGEIARDSRVWADAFSDVPPRAKPACGGLRFTLYFYLREGTSLKEIGVRKSELLTFLDRFHGVRIYRDGFRVKPYGDPGGDKDWLSLNLRRVQSPGGVSTSGYRIAENQVVGSVFISRRGNPALQDQTNREGLKENDAYRDMQKFLLHGVRFLEQERRARYQREKAKGGKPKSASEIEETLADSTQALNTATRELRAAVDKESFAPLFVSTETEHLREMVHNIEEASTRVQEAQAEAQTAYQEAQSELQLLSGLATLGIAMVTFGHETTGAVNSVTNRTQFLQDKLELLPDDARSEAQDDLAVLVAAAERIRSWGQFALHRVRRDKRTRENIDANAIIENVMTTFSGVLRRRRVEVVLDLSSVIPPIRAFPMDIEAILINFITNSVAAMRHNTIQRKIRVSTSYDVERGEISICFEDSGRGIRPEDVSRIFDPLFSMKTDTSGHPVGTGMGLTIVRNLTETYQGRVEVRGYGALGGAEFRVVLSRSGVSNDGSS